VCSPRYSFVIPVRDRLDFLPICIEHIVAQAVSDFDFEVVVAVHGPTPPPAVPEPARAVWWETEAPWNQAAAVNLGIANALGQRLVIVNADIIMSRMLLGTVELLLNQNTHQHIYWRRFDMTAEGLQHTQRLRGVDWDHVFLRNHTQLWVKRGWGKWHALTAYGDFLAVPRGPLLVLVRFDERMPGWGSYDVDMARRLTSIGCHEYWGVSFDLVHQYHEPQRDQRETGRRNALLCKWDLRTIKNGGASHFDKYREAQ